MKNRTKCKSCNDIIETIGKGDFIMCSCGKICISQREDHLRARFDNREDIVFVDDEGNEILPTYKDDIQKQEPLSKPNREELLEIMDEMVKRIQELPQHATLTPVTHADFASLLMLLSSIFRAA